MNEKTIMLVCSHGMSTSLLVNKMQESAKQEGLNYRIFATATAKVEEILSQERIDAILLGPQVKYYLDKIEAMAAPYGIPTNVIAMKDYGTMNGNKILQDAVDMMAGEADE